MCARNTNLLEKKKQYEGTCLKSPTAIMRKYCTINQKKTTRTSVFT